MLATIFLTVLVFFAGGYLVYGRFLRNRLGLDDDRATPAHALRDDMDYCPARAPILLGHHFSSIAGAGPILGPIIAGLAFGWLPVLLWVAIGAVFIGGVHDFGALVASIRHKARSVAEVARCHMSPTANKLFGIFIWLALVLVLAAFIDVTAKTFVEDGGVATASLIFIGLALLFGVAVYRMKLPLSGLTLIFVGLMGLGVWAGTALPLDAGWIEGLSGLAPEKSFTWILVAYCFVASIVPVWMLLQPRDYLSSFLLYGCLLGGAAGILCFDGAIEFPPFLSMHNDEFGYLVPALFIIVACGACSGFHSIVSSGTTAKQLNRETDAVRIGYGAMLLEGVLAFIALAAIMTCAQTDPDLGKHPTRVFAAGFGRFTEALGIPAHLGMLYGGLAISTFLLTTLDTATRLARYVFEELVGRRGIGMKLTANVCTLGLPLLLLNLDVESGGETLPAYKLIWPMFGATNQLLGGLALLTVTVWLKKTGRKCLFAAIPMVFMIVMTGVALVQIIIRAARAEGGLWDGANAVRFGYSLVLLVLAGFLVVEAWRSLRTSDETNAISTGDGDAGAV